MLWPRKCNKHVARRGLSSAQTESSGQGVCLGDSVSECGSGIIVFSRFNVGDDICQQMGTPHLFPRSFKAKMHNVHVQQLKRRPVMQVGNLTIARQIVLLFNGSLE
jgi:hypothetical protein